MKLFPKTLPCELRCGWLEDCVGLKLASPNEGWQNRLDMSPFTRPFRASILARARFIEDLVAELASQMQGFEIDQAGPQAWKRQRLLDLGFGIPEFLHLVPVDFEVGKLAIPGKRFRKILGDTRLTPPPSNVGCNRSVVDRKFPQKKAPVMDGSLF